MGLAAMNAERARAVGVEEQVFWGIVSHEGRLSCAMHYALCLRDSYADGLPVS